jgi:4-alpha-glucanotransferase
METVTKAPLLRLAELAGVETSYEDVFFKRHAASERALAGILRAMRFDVSSDKAIEAEIHTFTRRRCERGLEPVYVVTSGSPVRAMIVLRAGDRERELNWTVTSQDGATVIGMCDRAALQRAMDGEDLEPGYDARILELPGVRAEGYYALAVRDGTRTLYSRVIVTPASCYLPEPMDERGVWGLAAHVYALRSARDLGAGDFTDLRTLCEIVRDAGGAAVAVNPLHLLPRGAASPYGPSSRSFVNWVYLDVEQLPGARSGDVERMPAPPKAGGVADSLVDYAALYARKWSAARRAFERFTANASDTAERAAFDAYVLAGGDRLRHAATFEALAERFRTEPGIDDWRTWPQAYHDPHSANVVAFARENAGEIAFYHYLQWQCDAQLARVANACGAMPIGLYCDLAVGTQLGGVDTWLGDGALMTDVAAGAPPDLLNHRGQNWGVAPFDPFALREAGYEPFAALVRANARHAGALRIDHVMGLMRLWWVPSGNDATDGAYVTYRLDEMLGVLALESRRAQCLMVGEDLGTVPPGLREKLEAARVLSYRVLQFEHDDDGFFAPDAYPELALVSTGTHDLPTMAGFWDGTDIDVRARLGLLPKDREETERSQRSQRRAQLTSAFDRAGLTASEREHSPIGHVANAFLSQTPGRLLMVQLEDVLGETEQLNVPATTDEYPNWRHRSALALEDLATDDRFTSLLDIVRARSVGNGHDA